MSRAWTIRRIHHIAVAVGDVDEALAAYRALGIEARSRELVEAFATDAALLPVGSCAIELIAPRGNRKLERSLERRGPGLHHVALEVDHLDAALADLRERGMELVDEAPTHGIGNRPVAFVHPRATGGVLIELIEAPD